MVNHLIFSGTKAIALQDLPESAWTQLGANADTDDLQKRAATVAFLYRGIEIRANAFVAVPWEIRTAGDSKGEPLWVSEDEDAPAQLALLANLPQLLWQTEAAWCFKNEAFWHRERNRIQTLNLRWLDPYSVRPKWDADAGLVGFERGLSKGMPKTLAVEDVVYLWRQGLRETSPATPPAQAAAQAAGVLYNADAFAAQFFARGAIKATLLTVEGNPNPEEMKKLEAWWKRFFSGVRDAWSTAAVRAGVTPVTVGEGLESLTDATLTAEKREDISTALGVPYSLMMSNAANFATASQDEQNFYNLTIIPDCRLIQRQLNRQVMAPLRLRFLFKPQEMAVFQEDETERSQAFKNYADAGMKLSIAAEMLGLYLPNTIQYADLDVEPPAPAPVAVAPTMPPPAMPSIDMAAQAEMKAFRRWLKKRPDRDVHEFKADYLSYEELHAIAAEVKGAQGSETPDPFLVAGWGDYP